MVCRAQSRGQQKPHGTARTEGCARRAHSLSAPGGRTLGWRAYSHLRTLWREKPKNNHKGHEGAQSRKPGDVRGFCVLCGFFPSNKKAFDKCEGRKSGLRYSSSYFFFAAFFFVAFFFIGMVMFLLVERFSLGLQSPRIGYSSYRRAQTATPRYWAELLLVSIKKSSQHSAFSTQLTDRDCCQGTFTGGKCYSVWIDVEERAFRHATRVCQKSP
jgi:hypothetical protein